MTVSHVAAPQVTPVSGTFQSFNTMISDTPEWKALQEHAVAMEGTHLRARVCTGLR